MTSEYEVAARPKHIKAGVVTAGARLDPSLQLVRDSSNNIALVVALILAGVFTLYWRTTLSMVGIWERSETFAHGFVVVPIFCYLLWRRRDALAVLEPTPCWSALLGVAATGFVWLIGELVNAASVTQFAMVAMVGFAVWTVLGTRIAIALSIPLAFLFFAVPIGEFLVPTLMDWTADFTVAALRASGVPVYREGNYFMIPSGAWSVVEACSGLRYLIASLMIGCLYAYLSYRSPIRRATFIVASLIVPIVANWFRAYMIVMIGHLSSNRLAVGVDHLIYGWIFFGIVMVLLLWVGSRWREEDDAVAPRDWKSVKMFASSADTRWATWPRQVVAAVLATSVILAVWQPAAAYFEEPGTFRATQMTPIRGGKGWVSTLNEISAWKPDLSGPAAELKQAFTNGSEQVGLYIAFYRGQTGSAKAITSTNQLVRTTNQAWRLIRGPEVSVDLGSEIVDVRTGTVTRANERLAVWQWYWVDGHVTSSEYKAKMYQAISMLRGRGDSVAWVVIYTPTKTAESQARAILQQFTAAMQGSIGELLQVAVSK